MICEYCGAKCERPQPERKNHPIRCKPCRKQWRREYQRIIMRKRNNINPLNYRKPLTIFTHQTKL